MRIRTPFAAAFGISLLGFAYLGLAPDANPTPVNDKALHFVAFFILSLTGYWTVETSRRNLMKVVPIASFAADVGSEFLQATVNPSRLFDPADIAANVLGSFAAIALCAWYHKRMLERKRRRKTQGYGLVTTDDVADIELGEGPGMSGEEGAIHHEEDDDDGDAEAWDSMYENTNGGAAENGDAGDKKAAEA